MDRNSSSSRGGGQTSRGIVHIDISPLWESVEVFDPVGCLQFAVCSLVDVSFWCHGLTTRRSTSLISWLLRSFEQYRTQSRFSSRAFKILLCGPFKTSEFLWAVAALLFVFGLSLIPAARTLQPTNFVLSTVREGSMYGNYLVNTLSFIQSETDNLCDSH